jgi:Flp pilus assembly pilin Flp
MPSTVKTFYCSTKRIAEKKRLLLDEEGATIVEYVGMIAVAAIIVAAVILYLSTEGGTAIGRTVANMIDNLIASFERIP